MPSPRKTITNQELLQSFTSSFIDNTPKKPEWNPNLPIFGAPIKDMKIPLTVIPSLPDPPKPRELTEGINQQVNEIKANEAGLSQEKSITIQLLGKLFNIILYIVLIIPYIKGARIFLAHPTVEYFNNNRNIPECLYFAYFALITIIVSIAILLAGILSKNLKYFIIEKVDPIIIKIINFLNRRNL